MKGMALITSSVGPALTCEQLAATCSADILYACQFMFQLLHFQSRSLLMHQGLYTHVGDPAEAPGFSVAQLWSFQPSGSKPVDEGSASLFL